MTQRQQIVRAAALSETGMREVPRKKQRRYDRLVLLPVPQGLTVRELEAELANTRLEMEVA